MSRPRIRTLKPELWEDERVGGLSRDARLLFVGLVTMADDDGRLRALPAAIVGHVYPYDPDAQAHLERWLEEVVRSGLIQRYEAGGRVYLAFPNWRKHQRINRPTPSSLPQPPPPNEDSLSDHGGLTESSVADQIPSLPIPSSVVEGSTPPNPPRGGNRKRDRENHENELRAVARRLFPDDPDAWLHIRGAVGRGARTDDEVRAEVLKWHDPIPPGGDAA